MECSKSGRLRPILPILVLGAALTGCGSSTSSGYRAPPRPVPALPDSLDLGGCSSSTMGGGLLALCDPVLLHKASTLAQPGTLDVEIAGREVRVAGNPGLTQVIPDDGIGSLGVPAKVTLRGKASDGSYLYVRAASIEPDHYATGEALFRRLGLAYGGTATIDVALDGGRVAFTFRRPDGSEPEPLRSSYVDGPGPRAKLPELPDHYADTPEQGVRTYVAALNAHDGKTLCELWTADVRAQWRHEDYPCWATVSALIGSGSESDSPIFQRAELLDVGKAYSRKSHGVSLTAVPVKIRTHSLESRYSKETETTETSTVIWFLRTDDGWRIVQDPLTARSSDASAPPDPHRGQHARQAEQRREREARAARARSAVRLEPALRCARGGLALRDRAGDADVYTRTSARGDPRLSAGADVVAASLRLAGRRACFSATFRGRPLTGSERISLSLAYTPSSRESSRYTGFVIDHDFPTADGLHAGRLETDRGQGVMIPGQARVGVDGNTVSASFRLPPSFPTLHRSQLARLGWTISTVARPPNGPAGANDRAEGGLSPDKLAAAAAKAREARAKAREQARQAAAWAPARVHFDSGRVRCRGKPVSATDTPSDVLLMQPGSGMALHRSLLKAVSDLRSATVAVSGRHVCFAASLARQPFGRRQRRVSLQLGLSLTYRTRTAPYVRQAFFEVETNTQLENGLTYAGLFTGGASPRLRPAHAHVELHGKTVSADFDLERDFPSLRPAQLKDLTWKAGFSGSNVPSLREGAYPLNSYDQLPNNPDKSGNAISPEVRQSDGRAITPP